MRAVSNAICTSGEPVSDASRRCWPMISVLRSLVIAISILTTSAALDSCLDLFAIKTLIVMKFIKAGRESKTEKRISAPPPRVCSAERPPPRDPATTIAGPLDPGFPGKSPGFDLGAVSATAPVAGCFPSGYPCGHAHPAQTTAAPYPRGFAGAGIRRLFLPLRSDWLVAWRGELQGQIHLRVE